MHQQLFYLFEFSPQKNSNLPGVHGRATVQKSGLRIIQVMQVSKTPGRTPLE